MAIGDKFISFLPQFYTFKLRGICEGGHHPARAQVSCGGWASSIFKACFLIIVIVFFEFADTTIKHITSFFVIVFLLTLLYALGWPPKLAFFLF